jgi:hypothetical protein
MFADPGVRAVEDLQILTTAQGRQVQATVTVASSAVDLATVQAVTETVLSNQFGITQVSLTFKDPGPAPAQPTRGPIEKK